MILREDRYKRFTLRFARLGNSGQEESSNVFHTGLAECMTAEGRPVARTNLTEF
jgi:hypothetical protein